MASVLGNRAKGEHLAGKYNDWRAGASPLPALLSGKSSKLQGANRIESRKHHSQRRFFLYKHASKTLLGETTPWYKEHFETILFTWQWGCRMQVNKIWVPLQPLHSTSLQLFGFSVWNFSRSSRFHRPESHAAVAAININFCGQCTALRIEHVQTCEHPSHHLECTGAIVWFLWTRFCGTLKGTERFAYCEGRITYDWHDPRKMCQNCRGMSCLRKLLKIIQHH